MEGDGLRAEDEFLVLFVFCREQLENRVLETALVSLCSTRENHEGGEYDVMVCGHVCVFLRMMPFWLCENQSSLVLTYNAPWHAMTDLFASSRLNLRKSRSGFKLECASGQLASMVTANWHFFMLPRFSCGIRT